MQGVLIQPVSNGALLLNGAVRRVKMASAEKGPVLLRPCLVPGLAFELERRALLTPPRRLDSDRALYDGKDLEAER